MKSSCFCPAPSNEFDHNAIAMVSLVATSDGRISGQIASLSQDGAVGTQTSPITGAFEDGTIAFSQNEWSGIARIWNAEIPLVREDAEDFDGAECCG
jgi:hypothetical protein